MNETLTRALLALARARCSAHEWRVAVALIILQVQARAKLNFDDSDPSEASKIAKITALDVDIVYQTMKELKAHQSDLARQKAFDKLWHALQDAQHPALPAACIHSPTDISTPLRFPVRGGEWFVLREQEYANLCSAYPRLDIDAELHKAHAWLTCNAPRRKTARGMLRFLNGWLSKVHETQVKRDMAHSTNSKLSRAKAAIYGE